MNDEVLRFIWIIGVVAALMLLGEGLHKIFRAPKMPPRKSAEIPLEYKDETLEERYSIRHLERLFLMIFVSLVAFLFLLVKEEESKIPILISGVTGFWWVFRRGVLR